MEKWHYRIIEINPIIWPPIIPYKMVIILSTRSDNRKGYRPFIDAELSGDYRGNRPNSYFFYKSDRFLKISSIASGRWPYLYKAFACPQDLPKTGLKLDSVHRFQNYLSVIDYLTMVKYRLLADMANGRISKYRLSPDMQGGQLSGYRNIADT